MNSSEEEILNENNIKFSDNKSIIKTIKYNNLIYFKDNIFLSSDQYDITKIDLLEFKIDSFRHILTYDLNKLGKIQSLKPAKYSNDILINFSKKKT